MFNTIPPSGVAFIKIVNKYSVLFNAEELFIKDQDKPINILLETAQLDFLSLPAVLDLLSLVKRPMNFYSFVYYKGIENFAKIGTLHLAENHMVEVSPFPFKGEEEFAIHAMAIFEKYIRPCERGIHTSFKPDIILDGKPLSLLKSAGMLSNTIDLDDNLFRLLKRVRYNKYTTLDGPGGNVDVALAIIKSMEDRPKNIARLLGSAASANADLFISDIWKERYILPNSFLVFHPTFIDTHNAESIDKSLISLTKKDLRVSDSFMNIDTFNDKVITADVLVKDHGCKLIDYDYIRNLTLEHIATVDKINKRVGK